MGSNDPTTPDDATHEAEARDAHAAASGGPEPTAEEERLAEQAAAQAPDVSEPYEEALERGANLEGEGSIVPQAQHQR